jgi:SAM-dependent methyltransferase
VSQENYLLANQPSELERLQLQSHVWEPTGRQLLSKIGGGSGRRALDVGCGALGWLRILSEWVGPSGQVVGTDIDESLLDAARSFLKEEGISNVELVVDDLFETKLEPQSFDLVSEIFGTLGGEAGRGLPQLLGEVGIEEPAIDAHVIALEPGHPYLRLPLQFSVALESRLLERLSKDELASLRREAETELAEPGRWGTTFTVIQSWGRLEG